MLKTVKSQANTVVLWSTAKMPMIHVMPTRGSRTKEALMAVLHMYSHTIVHTIISHVVHSAGKLPRPLSYRLP